MDEKVTGANNYKLMSYQFSGGCLTLPTHAKSSQLNNIKVDDNDNGVFWWRCEGFYTSLVSLGTDRTTYIAQFIHREQQVSKSALNTIIYHQNETEDPKLFACKNIPQKTESDKLLHTVALTSQFNTVYQQVRKNCETE